MKCPHCGSDNDAQSGLGPAEAPEPGDVSLCAYCHGPGVYTDTGIRIPTAEEMAEIMSDPRFQAAHAALHQQPGVLAAIQQWRRAGQS